MLTITAHPFPGYTARTEHNAQVGSVTIAFAVDYNSGGEKLTRRAACEKYMSAPLPSLTPQTVLDVVTPARKLIERLAKSPDGRIVNVAGNSIRRLSEHGWRQELCDAYMFRVLALVHRHQPIEKIVSGVQSGVVSGIIAGVVLGIPTEVMMPSDLRQRPLRGPDVSRTKEEMVAMIEEGATRLRAARKAEVGEDVKSVRFQHPYGVVMHQVTPKALCEKTL